MALDDGSTAGNDDCQSNLGITNRKNEKKRRYGCSWLLRLVFPESMETSQIKITLLLFFAMFSTSLTITMVFPYLPRLIKDFGIDDVQIGTFAGMVASSYFVGKAIGSFFWGMVTDRCGRKPAVLASSFLLAVFTILFGFNWSLWWVTFARFMQGMTDGLLVAVKAAASDMTDETNQGAVMGILQSSFSLGLIIGPTLGGFLVLPHEQYPTAFSKDSTFAKYPYLLPNVVIFVILVANLVLVYFYMPETFVRDEDNEKKPLLGRINYSQSCSNDIIASDSGIKDKTRRCTNLLSSYEYSHLEKDSRKIRTYNIRDTPGEATYELIKQNEENSGVPETTCSHFHSRPKSFFSRLFRDLSCCKRREESSFLQIIRINYVRYITLLYGLYAFVAIANDELFPVYAAAPKYYHGLSFTTAQIGTALLIQTIPNIFIMITIAPKLEVRFGGRKLYVFAIYFYALTMPLIPCCSKLSNPTSLWAALIIILTTSRAASTFGYMAVNIILNNSVKPSLLGAANGLGMTSASLFRALSPPAVGSLFSWSLKNEDIGFPLNYNFSFLALSFGAILTLGLLVMIPKALDQKWRSLTTSAEDSSLNENRPPEP